jgi:hypothetical protein
VVRPPSLPFAPGCLDFRVQDFRPRRPMVPRHAALRYISDRVDKMMDAPSDPVRK